MFDDDDVVTNVSAIYSAIKCMVDNGHFKKWSITDVSYRINSFRNILGTLWIYSYYIDINPDYSIIL